MIHSGYTKLFSSIVASTIWREDDKTRLVWITLLALSDRDGYVAASLPGLADLAHVSIEDCEKAIGKLQQPDRYSRSPEHDGRRIEEVEGGWLILNRAKYRDFVPEEHRREVNRRRQQRHRKKQMGCEVTGVTVSRVTQRDSHEMSRKEEEEEEEEGKTPLSQITSEGTSLQGPPEGLTQVEYARRLLEDLGLPATGNIVVVADSISADAKKHGLTKAESFAFIQRQAISDQEAGLQINRFYFTDAKFRRVTTQRKATVSGDDLMTRTMKQLEAK